MAYLVIHARGFERQRFLLRKETIVGRGIGCDLWMDDPHLSRRHCKVFPSGDKRWSICDLSSNNGTFIDGRRLIGIELMLTDEQTIDVGDLRLVFYQADVVPQRAPDPVELLMSMRPLDLESASENETVVGQRYPLVRPLPRTEAELIVPKRRAELDIPLAFQRPRPRPIPR